MKKLLAIVVLGLLFSESADSAISFGSEKLLILTDQPGAHCVLTNNKGSWSVLTPGIVKVKRSKKKLNIVCNKEGYKETVTDYNLRDTSAVDADSATTSLSMAAGSAAAGDLLSAGIDVLITGLEVMDSKFGTYANTFGNDKNKRQPTIFITLNKI